MFNRILVPLDGSLLAEAALPAAVELASKFNSELTLVRVLQPPHLIMTVANGSVYAQLLTEMRHQAEHDALMYLRGHQSALRQKGFVVHIEITEGENVADALLQAASSLVSDTIVMSTHGRSGVSRWVFGSVADKVLRHAEVPVLLIRAKEEPLNWKTQPAEAVV